MPTVTTSYHSIDGELWGETSSAAPSSTIYLSDALGSITGAVTADLTPSIIVFQRFRATGVAAFASVSAPEGLKFNWCGTLGYRSSEAYSTSFVRLRHYSNEDCRWNSVDRLWPGQPSYNYVAGRMVSVVDPSGLSPQPLVSRTIVNCSYGYCGDFEVSQIFSAASARTGYIIQKITGEYHSESCNNIQCTSPCGSSFTYYEAWKVVAGVVWHPDGGGGWNPPKSPNQLTDSWSSEDCPGSYGSQSRGGSLMFFWWNDLPPGFEVDFTGQDCSGSNPSSTTFKGFTPYPGTDASVFNTWGCCTTCVDAAETWCEKTAVNQCRTPTLTLMGSSVRCSLS